MNTRMIQSTDREWETIRIRAKAEGMTLSDFVMACGLFKEPKTKQQSEIPIEEPAMPRTERLAFYNKLHDLVNIMTSDTEYFSRPMRNAAITSPSGEGIMSRAIS